MTDWKRMDLSEFHRSGLLYYVNRTVLWPLGLALTLVLDKATDEYTELYIQRIEPYDQINSGWTSEEEDQKLKDAMAWIGARITEDK